MHFDQANKMVADERRLRAEMEEELKELKTEKEALRSALRIVAGEDNTPHLNAITSSEVRVTPSTIHTSYHSSHSRTSSQVGIKSRPQSPELASLYPLPPSPAPHSEPSWQEDPPAEETSPEGCVAVSLPTVHSPIEQSHSTPGFLPISGTVDGLFIDVSPWADAVSSPTSALRGTPTTPTFVRPEAR